MPSFENLEHGVELNESEKQVVMRFTKNLFRAGMARDYICRLRAAVNIINRKVETKLKRIPLLKQRWKQFYHKPPKRIELETPIIDDDELRECEKLKEEAIKSTARAYYKYLVLVERLKKLPKRTCRSNPGRKKA